MHSGYTFFHRYKIIMKVHHIIIYNNINKHRTGVCFAFMLRLFIINKMNMLVLPFDFHIIWSL